MMRPLRFNAAPLLTWLLGLVLLSVSACARPVAATGPDPAVARVEITATQPPTPTPTSVATPSPSPSPTPARLSLAGLQNLSYPLYSQEGWAALLKDGAYDSDDDADFPLHIQIDARSPLFGDVNGDGLEDAVVLLYSHAAASGQFHDLVFVLNRNGEPQIFKSIFLGDKVAVEAITISPKGITTVTILSRNSAGGTQEEVRQYGPFKE